MLAAVRRFHFRAFNLPVGDVVALDPGAVIAFGDVVLFGAGAHTTAAADALGDVDQHGPPVLGEFVVGGGFGGAGLDIGPSDRGSGQEHEKSTAGTVHYFLASVAGLGSGCVSIFGR